MNMKSYKSFLKESVEVSDDVKITMGDVAELRHNIDDKLKKWRKNLSDLKNFEEYVGKLFYRKDKKSIVYGIQILEDEAKTRIGEEGEVTIETNNIQVINVLGGSEYYTQPGKLKPLIKVEPEVGATYYFYRVKDGKGKLIKITVENVEGDTFSYRKGNASSNMYPSRFLISNKYKLKGNVWEAPEEETSGESDIEQASHEPDMDKTT